MDGKKLKFPVLLTLALPTILMIVAFTGTKNLSWDDADYLRDGLRVAHTVEFEWSSRPGHALGALLRVRPKPPLLVAWITLGSLYGPLRQPSYLYNFSSIVPFAALLCGVVLVAHGLYGRRAATLALLCVAASPMALSFGSKVMVETFMGLWVLAAFTLAAKLLERPDAGRAFALGAVLGLACLTKMTAALILPVPAAITWVVLVRRHGWPTAVKAAGWTLGALMMVAGPWYFKNGPETVRFAFFSARYNQVALGSAEVVGTRSRLLSLADDVAGWPVLGAVAVAGAGLILGRREIPTSPGSSADFAGLAIAGVSCAALTLLLPPYFDPRFFLPAWPSLTVVLGALLAESLRQRGRFKAILVVGLLGLGLFSSVDRLTSEPRTKTYWAARSLIDFLVHRYGVANIYNVGNCRDWNVSKTGLINELRDDPRDCFVLHDLSGSSTEEFFRRLDGAESVVTLDRARLPEEWFAYGPGLNRNLDLAVAQLQSDRRFLQVVDFPSVGLPPLLVFVRCDVQSARAVGHPHR